VSGLCAVASCLTHPAVSLAAGSKDNAVDFIFIEKKKSNFLPNMKIELRKVNMDSLFENYIKSLIPSGLEYVRLVDTRLINLRMKHLLSCPVIY